MDKVRHWNIISSVVSDDLTPWYTTVDNDEVIQFVSADGVQRNVNALTVWANTSDLYIKVGDTSYCVYVPANASVSLDYLQLQKMTVMGNAGIKLRYVAMYY